MSITMVLAAAWDDRIFGLDPQLLVDALITTIAMLFVFLLLSYLLFNPARELMRKRQELIKDEMDTAAKEKEDAIKLKREYDTKLNAADAEVEDILREARKKALKNESEIVDEAKNEAKRIVERAEKEAELEKKKVQDEVKQEMITVASAMAGKIIASSMNEEEQSKLIAETLEEMGDETWQS